uniref:Retrovirus-related Pol polyprotein from transposon TNT 1-94 n=1 Tax=Tanacetum cinerariifolium TaxID=118510 RepID=A0A699HFW6_TANCI|nr:retrovirus-related Pol polyprotein from transposon TNT 1-94 [Tanacetum cinerariifolium]
MELLGTLILVVSFRVKQREMGLVFGGIRVDGLEDKDGMGINKSLASSCKRHVGCEGKFNAKAYDGYFLGYSFNSKAFRVFNTRSQQIEKTYHVTFDESMEAIRFINTSVDEIRIDDSSMYPPDEYHHEDGPSRQYQSYSNISYYIIPHGRSLTELAQEKHVPEVIAPNEPNIPHTEDVEGPLDLINTKGTHEQNVKDEQIIIQSTIGSSGQNTDVSVANIESSALDAPQSHISNQASTGSHPSPQDRWSKDKHIELVNIIGDPGEGMLTRLTRSMVVKLTSASTSECLLLTFSLRWNLKRNKKGEHGITIKNKARLVAQGYSQEEGIKYDETFTIVERREAIKIFLAFATYMNFIFQMDVKSAFLTGKLKKEVCVKQPPGFKSSEFPNYVCKLDKVLFGLKKAPRACGNYSSTEQVNSIQQLFAYCLLTWTKTPTETKVTPSKPTEGSKQSHLVSSGIVPDPQDPKRNIQLAGTGLPSTLNEGTRKSKPLPKVTNTDPKDSGGNVLPADKGLPSTIFDEGAAKTTPLPEGPRGDKESEELKPPADIKPHTNPVVDPLRTDAKKCLLLDEDTQTDEETDKLVQATMDSLDKASTDMINLLKALTKVTETLKVIQDAVKDDSALNKKVIENVILVVTKKPSYTEEETEDIETQDTDNDKVEKEQVSEEPKHVVLISTTKHTETLPPEVQPITIIISTSEPEPLVPQREGKGEKFKKAQDTKMHVHKRQHTEKVKRLTELNKKRAKQYMWTMSNRLKPEPINDVKIHPNSKPAVLIVYINNDTRNFEVHNPFKFRDFEITELDELLSHAAKAETRGVTRMDIITI